MNSLLESALEYATKGWKLLPLHTVVNGRCSCGRSDCTAPGKHPRIVGGVNAASADKRTVRMWWTRWPNANIGCVCGPESFTAIDIDPRHGGDASLDALAKEHGGIPQTLCQLTGGGGRHLLFQHNPDCPCTVGTLGKGLDTRGQGKGYIILAPSVHASGGQYEWENSLSPAPLPSWLIPRHETSSKPVEVKSQATPDEKTVEARAIRYLDTLPPAIQGSGGHSALLWAARALVWGFELPRSTAIQLLWSNYNPRCVPPWDATSPTQAAEFERKVDEAERTPCDKPRGWLLQDQPDTGDLETGATIADTLLAPQDVPDAMPAAPSAEWDDSLLHPPGLVGDICRWINDSAGCYQPILALGAALTACGALFGRKIKDEANGRTNLYAMGVAHSSAGKDHPAYCIERLFHAAGAETLLGGQVTSDSAIEVALMETPVKLFCWDEVGHIFANIKLAGVGVGSAHLRTIVPSLMQLYSSPHKLYVGKQRADGCARRIDQPHVCVWGLTSPQILFSSLSRSELRDGWLGRVMTFISMDRPKYRTETQEAAPPRSIVSKVSEWIRFNPPAPAGQGDIASLTSANPVVIPTEPEAYAVLNAFRDEAYDAMIAADKVDDDTQFLWGKALQNARRIALILAAGIGQGTPITPEIADIAVRITRTALLQFSSAIRENVADSQTESDKVRILQVIKKHPKGMSKNELTRATQWIKDRRTREDYLNDLLDSGIISQRTDVTRTRPKLVYFAR